MACPQPSSLSRPEYEALQTPLAPSPRQPQTVSLSPAQVAKGKGTEVLPRPGAHKSSLMEVGLDALEVGLQFRGTNQLSEAAV